MKTNKFIAVALLGLAVVACAPKGPVEPDETKPETLLPTKAETDSVSYLIGVNFGSFIKGYNFGDVNYSQIQKGIKDFLAAKGDQRDSTFAQQFKIDPSLMNELFNDYLSKMQKYTAAKNQIAEDKFLAENAKKEGVQTTESGLQYEIIEAGDTVRAAGRDTIYVHYKGQLIDGTVFDQSPEGGDAVRLFANRIIKGWQEGLGLIGQGGKIKLYIPSKLGYGAQGTRGIEPNSPLIFDVELEKVSPYVHQDQPAQPARPGRPAIRK